MKMYRFIDNIGNDFWADYICEHCGHIERKVSGYDDAHYHRNVIPAMQCRQCGKNSAGDTAEGSGPRGERHV